MTRPLHRRSLLPLLAGTLLSSGCAPSGAAVPARAADAAYRWHRTDTQLALLDARDRVIWQLNHNPARDKPYFHPVRTPAGHDLTMPPPPDHPWHRGLWFSWKDINGVNYWEEDLRTGLAPGRTRIVRTDIDPRADGSAEARFDLEYAPAGGPVVMRERRTVSIGAPDERGAYRIDWLLDLRAEDAPVVLDREPPPEHGGPPHGGYVGLSYRAAASLGAQRYLDSTGWTNEDELTGYGRPARWMDLSGRTGPGAAPAAGLTMFDHPANPRHPSPWFVWYKAGKHAFFSASLLYHEPLRLAPRESLYLRYRVLVHPGYGEPAALEEEWRSFADAARP